MSYISYSPRGLFAYVRTRLQRWLAQRRADLPAPPAADERADRGDNSRPD
jgi:hypothetical protein